MTTPATPAPSGLRIRHKILAGNVLVVLLISVFIAVSYPARQRARTQEAERARVVTLAEMLALSVGVGLELHEPGVVAAAFRWVESDPTVLFVVVADSTGTEFASYPSTGESFTRIPPPATSRSEAVESDADIQVATPLQYRGRTMGTLWLGVSLESMAEQIAQDKAAGMLVSLMVLAVGVGFSFLLARRIVHPLEHLTQVADRVASGAYDAEVKVSSSDEVGALAHAFGTMLDRLRATLDDLAVQVEERSRAEGAERDAKDRLQSLVDNAVVGIYVADPDGKFLEVNRSLVEMLRYSSAADLLRTDPAVICPDPRCRAEVVRAHSGAAVIEDLEVDWVRKDGAHMAVRLNGKAILRDGLPAFEVVAEDVTERVVMENLLREEHKMRAIGRLAGGIAHEFNNLLTTVGLTIGLARESLEEEDPLRDELASVDPALRRATTLTTKLQAFSGVGNVQPQLLDFSEVLAGLGEIIRNAPSDTSLEVVGEPGIGRVLLDPTRADAVVLELVFNAREAIPNGGHIRISTSSRREEAPAGEADEVIEAGGKGRWFTVLTVSDDGEGMDPSAEERCFEPFFTTKGPGEGTGLGLSTVYGIATDGGGRVRVETAPGEGTTLEVWLPVADPDWTPSDG